DRELPPGMDGEPAHHYLGQEGRQGYVTEGEFPALVLFLLAEPDHLCGEVEVVDLRTQDLASPSPGMCGKDEHGVDPREAIRADVVEKLLDFGHGQEHGVPEVSLLFLSQLPAGGLALNLVHRLEGGLRLALLVDQ